MRKIIFVIFLNNNKEGTSLQIDMIITREKECSNSFISIKNIFFVRDEKPGPQLLLTCLSKVFHHDTKKKLNRQRFV